MGNIFTNSLGLLKQWFGKKQAVEKQAEQIAKGHPVEGYMRYEMFSRYGLGFVTNYLKLSYELSERYRDYEEMESYPEIAAAIKIVADNCTQPSTLSGHIVWVESPNAEIKEKLTRFLHKQININEHIWALSRNVVKYGNWFIELLLHPEHGVIGFNSLPVQTMRRVQSDRGRLIGFYQDLSESTGLDVHWAEFEKWIEEDKTRMPNMILFKEHQVVHFRLGSLGYDPAIPNYGISYLESCRPIWRRILLMDDAVLLYRLTRSPQKYVVYVDVGNVNPKEVGQYLRQIKDEFNKKKFVDQTTGQLSSSYSPMASDENFYVGIHGDKDQTRIENLSVPIWDYIEDVNYYHSKLFTALMIPRAYLSYDADVKAKAVLSAEDVNFSRTILRIQNDIKQGIRRICDIYLITQNIDPLTCEYSIEMVPPSQIYEAAQMDLRKAKIEFANMLRDWADKKWIMKNILQMSDSEIEQATAALEKEILEPEERPIEAPRLSPEPYQQNGNSTLRAVADRLNSLENKFEETKQVLTEMRRMASRLDMLSRDINILNAKIKR